MRRINLLPRLVNRKDGDPGLLVELGGTGRLYLFDCGSNERLAKRDLMRISHVFVSHTHIDHWIGFDRLLRHSLGEPRDIHIWGPAGLLDNLQGKFRGYLWNLEEAGPDFIGHELDGQVVKTRCFGGSRQFRGSEVIQTALEEGGVLSEDEGVVVRCAALEHRGTSLGFAVETRPYPSIRTHALEELGLHEGPWLTRLKEAAASQPAAGAELQAGGRRWPVRELLAKLVELKPGEKIAYVTDTLFNEATQAAVAELARDATVFFCEANFRDDEVGRATFTCHLTAGQAGAFARAAGARKLVLFHISRKYNGDFGPSLAGARQVFDGPVE